LLAQERFQIAGNTANCDFRLSAIPDILIVLMLSLGFAPVAVTFGPALIGNPN